MICRARMVFHDMMGLDIERTGSTKHHKTKQKNACVVAGCWYWGLCTTIDLGFVFSWFVRGALNFPADRRRYPERISGCSLQDLW